jgi:precorrin-6A/cobalt-precorrin-6A reductase
VILLLGGTSETAPLISALQREGLDVLVSTATDAPLELPAGVRRRCGRLDAQEMADLCKAEGIRVLVDAGHPYAVHLHRACQEAAALAGVSQFRLLRPVSDIPPEATLVASHENAAQQAFAHRGPVLLTTGSRNLAPYVAEARRTGLLLTARVLDHPESLAACAAAGLSPSEIVSGRGPYNQEEDCTLIRRCGAQVLVTKDSGEAGGLQAKVEAARQTGCKVIVVTRPDTETNGFTDPDRLAKEARRFY